MSFRVRLLIVFTIVVLLPIVVLAVFVRNEMTSRMTTQYEERVGSLVAVIEADLAQERESIAAAIDALESSMQEDPRWRRAAVDRDPAERRYLLDYAGRAMQLAGLAMLQIQDDTGRVLSSGHFRNEYDRLDPELPHLLTRTPHGTAVVETRAPDGTFLALVRVGSFKMAGATFTVVAGVRVEQAFLARLEREAGVDIALLRPGSVATVGGKGAIVRDLVVPFVDSERTGVGEATFHVTHDLTALQALRASADRWFFVAFAIAIVAAIALGGWLASRVSRPLTALAEKTSRVDLDHLDVVFDTGRNDEIGTLSRVLDTMTERLRSSASRIKDAERRATLGEIARQVNHDIRNGLTPIRNVFRHLVELVGKEPGHLPGVFRERQGTIDSSISYLENLATNYARLSPRRDLGPCDVGAIVRRIVADRQETNGVTVAASLTENAFVEGDPVSLRRVLENLVDNAVDSVESPPGHVTVKAECVDGDDGRVVRITVSDNGRGMSDEQLAHAFDDFYTTKTSGTGLGLSIVRRLVMDLGGEVRVESESGKGSHFIIDLPRME